MIKVIGNRKILHTGRHGISQKVYTGEVFKNQILPESA